MTAEENEMTEASNFAKFNHIGFDSSGRPRPADLHGA